MPIQEGGQFSPDNNIVSPGVFTRELDQSGVAAGIANIGGVVVAPFAKGPAFSPTTFTDINSLQNSFGVPDGTYYGPYTATQYLQEQGTVTICRVGPLTGYWQKYPFVIFAVQGEWTEAESAGTLNSTYSYFYFSGSSQNNYSESVSIAPKYYTSTSTAYSSSVTQSIVNIYSASALTIINPLVDITFNSGVGDAFNGSGVVTPTYAASNSGSLLYYGKQISLGSAQYIYGLTNPSSSVTVTTVLTPTSSIVTTTYYDGIVNGSLPTIGDNFSASISSGNFSANIVNSTFSSSAASVWFPGGTYPFGGLVDGYEEVSLEFVSSSISVNLGVCGTPIFNLQGVITGTFGNYNGGFDANIPYFDPCIGTTGAWTGSGNIQLLAVLADTEAGGIENLVAPGFNGSSMVMTNNPSGSNVIIPDFSLTLKNSNSSTPYGTYQFSLDSGDPHFITNVFGNSATVGNPAKQVSGQKIEAAYTYVIYEDAIDAVVGDITQWKIYGIALPTISSSLSGSSNNPSGMISGEPLDFTDNYSYAPSTGDSQFSITNATTPWVLSQAIAPWQSGSSTPTRFELFQIATIADGTYTNQLFKIEISNVKLAGTVAGSDYGSFSLIVRQFSDTDKKPVIVEQYNNLNLDPESANYIARVIGDQYSYITNTGKVIEFGDFANNSQNIRVIMTQNNYPESAVPYGFEAYSTPTNGQFGYWTPPMKYTKASVYGLNPGKYPSGITFNDAPTGADVELFSLYPTSSVGVGASDDNTQYMAPLPSFNVGGTDYDSIGQNVPFALDIDYQSYGVGTGSFLNPSLSNVVGNAIPAIYDPVNEPTYVKMRSFVFGFQGGFDGQSPAVPINLGGDIIAGNTQGLDCTTVSSAGSIAYNQCVSALGNADQYDINLIVTPGIIYEEHPYVTNLVVDMCESRGDVFYIADMYVDEGNPATSQISQVVSYAAEFDTNYAATYYPWVKILDTNINQIVTVPPSVVLPAVYAANDQIAAEWFAPAGLNRGGITVATQVTDRTTHEERDTLYEGKVNPIATFPGAGIVVWGQKTLQNADSALNRINVRRLLIKIKKFFASTSQYLVFEQNVAATRNKFLSIVNPYLESVQQRSGLYAFYVQMDEKNNTSDVIDQNILYGQIYLKPTKTAEFIILDFNILPTGSKFSYRINRN